MTLEFYINDTKNRSGPYDLVAIVRKIRNGTLTAVTLLEVEGHPEPKPAAEWPQLAEFFAENKDEHDPVFDRKPHAEHSLGTALKSGWRFLQRHQYTSVFSGMFVLLSILAAAAISFTLPTVMYVFAFMALFVVAYVFLSIYLFGLLRVARGQPVDVAYLKKKFQPAVKPLLLSSFFICMPCMLGLALLISPLPSIIVLIGLFLFAVPGLFCLAIHVFTPLLILDKNYDLWEAMETSRKTVLKNGLESAGVIYALFVINFLAGLLFLLPLALTLPITMGALSEIYDDLLS